MKRFGDEKGAALILALVVMMVLTLLSVSILTQATGKVNAAQGRLTEAELVQAVEAGLDAAIVELKGLNVAGQDGVPTLVTDGNLGVDGWGLGSDSITRSAGDPDRILNGIPNFGEYGVEPLSYRGIQYYTWAEFFCNDGRDNDGDGKKDTVNPDGTPRDEDLKDVNEVYYVRVLVFARRDPETVRAAETREVVYEAMLKSAGCVKEHDFFYFPFAIGSCNQLDIPFELAFGGQTGASYWRCTQCGYLMSSKRDCPQCGAPQTQVENAGTTNEHSDTIIGDIFHDGDMKWTQGARADGNISATGEVKGNPGPDAVVTSFADPIEAPSLADMNYAELADYVIDENTPLITHGYSYGTSVSTPPEDDPRHIFVENYRDDLGELADNTYDNGDGDAVDQWMLADTWEGNSYGNISLHPTEGTDKVYYVKGDLWLETGAYHSMFVDDPEDGSRITIVVEGNIYVCDDFWVVEGSSHSSATPPEITDDSQNAIAFIAVTGGRETFTDMNGNWTWDPGEPILNDDGDGVYGGPRYGCGNITYGDPNTGPVGHSQAFFYAENNFKDYCLDGDGQPLDIGITGLMSAGGLLDINRDFGNKHAEMTSITDTRLYDKLITLPGLPRTLVAGSQYPVGPFEVKSWRRVR